MQAVELMMAWLAEPWLLFKHFELNRHDSEQLGGEPISSRETAYTETPIPSSYGSGFPSSKFQMKPNLVRFIMNL